MPQVVSDYVRTQKTAPQAYKDWIGGVIIQQCMIDEIYNGKECKLMKLK